MARFMVIALGVDQPGVIAAISSVLVEQGCNLGDTQMAVLQGYASMMLVVDTPAGLAAEGLRQALAEGAAGLDHTFSVEPLEDLAEPVNGGRSWRVAIYGSDRPGIVFEVTRLLADAGINVVDARTRLAGRSYSLWMQVRVPAGADGEAVAARIDRLGRELGLSCSMQPVPGEPPTFAELEREGPA